MNVQARLTDSGLDLVAHKRYREALAVFEEVISTLPSDEVAQLAEAYALKARVLDHLKRYEEAVHSLYYAIALDGNDTDLWFDLLTVLFRMHNFSRMLTVSEQCLRTHSDDARIWQLRGNAFGAQKRYQEAVLAYRRALIIPDSSLHTLAAVATDMGKALAGLGRHEEALEAFRLALRYSPVYLPASRGRTTVLLKLHRWAEFRRSLRYWLRLRVAGGRRARVAVP